MPLKLIICGGGIGGLAAAGYLRAKHQVTVLERGTLDFTRDDYGLSIVSNSFNLLQKAGIKPENMDAIVMTHLWLRGPNNEEVLTKHFDTTARYGGPSVLVKRAKLLGELWRFATSKTDFAGEPAEIVENAKVARVDVDAGHVWTQDGRQFSGDLIVGADGINSVVRNAVLAGQDVTSPIRNHDTMAFMAQVPIDEIRSNPDLVYLSDPKTCAGLCSAHAISGSQLHKRILTYHTSAHSLQVVAYTSEKEFDQKFNSSRTAIIKDVPVSRVLEEFVPDFTDSFINLLRHSKIDAWRIRDVAPMDSWWSGKALLIGDAAHAVTPHAGQGCNITIEDAEALGYLLKDVESPEVIPAALQDFMLLRKDRVEYVARRSREIGNIRTEDDKTKEPILSEEFSMKIYTYQGAERALIALKLTMDAKGLGI
ncbi:FAD/NAD(P)-binding domain-containing protein [Hypoxylon sp. FL1284]|nr:FAD/NAD(P)-binding domain-containing protein [Hypoxylon sp. FL1284]